MVVMDYVLYFIVSSLFSRSVEEPGWAFFCAL